MKAFQVGGKAHQTQGALKVCLCVLGATSSQVPTNIGDEERERHNRPSGPAIMKKKEKEKEKEKGEKMRKKNFISYNSLSPSY